MTEHEKAVLARAENNAQNNPDAGPSTRPLQTLLQSGSHESVNIPYVPENFPSNQYPAAAPPAYSTASTDSWAFSIPFGSPVGVDGMSNNIGIPAMRYDTMTSYQGAGSGQATTITTRTVLDQPILVRCPFCNMAVTSVTSPIVGCLTWLSSLGIAMTGLFCGCCLIPFCIRRLLDVKHTCPRCKNVIALYKRI